MGLLKILPKAVAERDEADLGLASQVCLTHGGLWSMGSCI